MFLSHHTPKLKKALHSTLHMIFSYMALKIFTTCAFEDPRNKGLAYIWSKYDHFVFSGAVPRTFLGSVLLAWLSAPVIQFAVWWGLVATKFDLQIISKYSRNIITTLNLIPLQLGLCSQVWTHLGCALYEGPFHGALVVSLAFYLLCWHALNFIYHFGWEERYRTRLPCSQVLSGFLPVGIV